MKRPTLPEGRMGRVLRTVLLHTQVVQVLSEDQRRGHIANGDGTEVLDDLDERHRLEGVIRSEGAVGSAERLAVDEYQANQPKGFVKDEQRDLLGRTVHLQDHFGGVVSVVLPVLEEILEHLGHGDIPVFLRLSGELIEDGLDCRVDGLLLVAEGRFDFGVGGTG